ncbi:MAG: N-6 DNA methylase [Chloroflexota bacterium]|nr:N-6 DNA methylase [Chloroflexota bacterium]
MASYPHIERYRFELERLIAFGGSVNESSIRRAFAACLDSYCREHRERLALVDELAFRGGVYPDGTVKDSLRMARGYWEAKDTYDDLDAEIQAKFNRGYPTDNIIFEDSETAVLVQNGETAMRVDMARPGELHRLIRRFLDYELPEIEDFRRAQSQFKDDLPSVLDSLRATVEEAERHNTEYQGAAEEFLELCHQSIGPDVSDLDVREMLLQHILTKDIFLRVFEVDQFHRENNIARRLDTLERTFFTGDTRWQAIRRLRSYYGAITKAATGIADYAEKQSFLKAIYEDFYKAYNPAAADRLGVVYTPNEVVDFIIRGADYLLGKHFGRSLADENVQILDPATGTGTFITNLIEYLPAGRLEHKYLHEMHANEVAILPYYIANLNIEYTYREKTGRYLEFPNLVFVDTLDNMDWQGATGGAVQRQGAFELGGMSTENWMRVNLQNEKTISVILGNPPYNANQQNANDNNRNREYPAIDRRIRETYVAESTAQKTKQYDMYKRFIRWASDRLADDGIIAFITNRAYIDARQDDGFRKVAAQEFSDIYILDLGSDVRRNPRISGTKHNVFGIQTGVAIGFFVREKAKLGECGIHYAAREDAEIAIDKLAYLNKALLEDIELEQVMPDKRNDWLNQGNPDFEWQIPLINRETKYAKSDDDEQSIFGLYSLGIASNRDEWTYDFATNALLNKVKFFCGIYQHEMRRLDLENPEEIGDWVDRSIKWTPELERHLIKGDTIEFTPKNVVPALYRPFIAKQCYFAPIITHRRYQQHQLFPHGDKADNRVICFSGVASNKPFSVLATDKLYSLDLLEKTQCLPLYRYTEDGERVSNVTEWGLRRINAHYRRELGANFEEVVGGPSITAEDAFAYTYAVLHDPAYRHDYAIDLLREFPRLPLYHDWNAWVKMGRELLELHIGFEDVEPYPLERVDNPGKKTSAPSPVKGEGWDGGDAPKPMLRANARDKERGEIHIDSETVLRAVPADAWRYMLGNRSALEWVLDQYKEKKPRDPTIRERFNTYRFANYKEHVIDLLRRVCTVSVKTMDVVDGMAYWEGEYLVVSGDRDKHEWTMMGLQSMFSRANDMEQDIEWSVI